MNKPNTIQPEQEAVIYFKFPPTDGTTGPQWSKKFKQRGLKISSDAEAVLNSNKFIPTRGIVYEVAILNGNLWEKDFQVSEENILSEAVARDLSEVNVEVACLCLENLFFDGNMMGREWIITMHKPINNNDGIPCRLNIYFINYQKKEKQNEVWLGVTFRNTFKKRDGFILAKKELTS